MLQPRAFQGHHPIKTVFTGRCYSLGMRYLLFACFLFLAGCGSAMPVVDYAGKNPVQAQLDLTACKHEKDSQLFTAGAYISRCMEQKGYLVLDRSS
jgi:hypothetical protein